MYLKPSMHLCSEWTLTFIEFAPHRVYWSRLYQGVTMVAIGGMREHFVLCPSNMQWIEMLAPGNYKCITVQHLTAGMFPRKIVHSSFVSEAKLCQDAVTWMIVGELAIYRDNTTTKWATPVSNRLQDTINVSVLTFVPRDRITCSFMVSAFPLGFLDETASPCVALEVFFPVMSPLPPDIQKDSTSLAYSRSIKLTLSRRCHMTYWDFSPLC